MFRRVCIDVRVCNMNSFTNAATKQTQVIGPKDIKTRGILEM
jgi:hypothetical protein